MARSKKPDWNRLFAEPVTAPDGTRLLTLKQAIAYLAATVPANERSMPDVTTAATILTQAAEGGPAWMFMARIAASRAIHRHEPPRPIDPNFKETQWGKRKLKRDQ